MKLILSSLTSVLLLIAVAGLSAAPTPDELARIKAAVPSKASAKPHKPRKLLVFSRAWGYWHTAIPYGEAAIRMMGEKTKAFDTTITNDDSFFEPDRLAKFDAVVFNNTNNEIFLPENFSKLPPAGQEKANARDTLLKKSLRGFLSDGKGLMVIHAGIASFRKWPEYGAIVGARFESHPWNAGSTVTLKIEDPEHCLCHAFPSDRFTVTDEIYQFKEFDRKQLRVLFSLDTTGMDLAKIKGIRRTDRDFALSWIKNYGKGRVFYSALGHQHDIFWNPTVLQHYLDGIQFALGDLTATTESIPAR